MGPLVPLAIFALQEAIKYAPALAEEIRLLLTKGDPTEADWLALQQKYLGKSYKDLVPDTGLTDTEAT